MSHVIQGMNDLKTQRPDLLKDWDYDLNADVSPEQISIGSEKKVWWKCNKGHSYQLSVGQKAHGQGCTLCAGKTCVTGINDLATMRPDLLEEWDYSSNGPIDPRTIYYRSYTSVQWRCALGHTWSTKIVTRTEQGAGCPVCSGNTILAGFNDLLSGFPEVASEWDYGKNGFLLPSMVARFSTKRVWWKCKECNYEWKAQVANRTRNKSGCPNCKRYSHTSFPEQALFFYCRQAYPNAVNGYRYSLSNKRSELDVYIPELKTGIEYDGVAWHKNDHSFTRDLKKYESCQKEGIRLIRVSEFQLEQDHQACDAFVFRKSNDMRSLQAVIEDVLHILEVDSVDVDVIRDRDFIMSLYINVQKEKSLAFCYPEIARQWLYEKNGDVTPEKVNSTTDKWFWWKCDKGHEWRNPVVRRTSAHSGCPYCSGKKLLKGYNDLETRYPEVAKWWDNEKNVPLRACDIMPGSVKYYWWICEKGHSYQCKPNVKTGKGTGCPICSNSMIVSGINSFADLYPKHYAFWNKDLNEGVCPDKISAGSMKTCYWKCSVGHLWKEKVAAFSRRKPECPFCSGLWLLTGFNDLETEHPDLIMDWDYDKNTIKPSEVRSNSTVPAYWKCHSCGYEWRNQIRRRAIDGAACPICCYTDKVVTSRMKTLLSSGRSLAERFPEIAAEWDYDNNNGRTPENVTFGSNLMASWICPKGHKYKARVTDRTGKKKCGCSYCRYEKASQSMKKKKYNKR
ncbi:zinc-ribbon domain-containing protein [Aristaeella lactis]|uniref:Probable Zinc-ribbon domain-containing protein n=1 Tax=Aristaeella lactis TaxID=3046383 RepID=A0AC61PL64_9FIRM|nr:zinc-ribbon domain-containing protein [Aristaeella lactis]QUA52196.1 zinc-ribbon domain-containing protein [Aristaeella lactis]SMC58696.1 Probable Zinc-ribbon domain-containing protein [Aristaeella lactis]